MQNILIQKLGSCYTINERDKNKYLNMFFLSECCILTMYEILKSVFLTVAHNVDGWKIRDASIELSFDVVLQSTGETSLYGWVTGFVAH